MDLSTPDPSNAPEESALAGRQDGDDVERLLDALPNSISVPLAEHRDRADLLEVVLDLGRPPEARFPGLTLVIGSDVVSRDDLIHVTARLGRFSEDNRAGIERTLHRISALRNRCGEIVGLTCRIGRAVQGTIEIVRDVIESGQSTLLLGRPGVGKTTLLREAARVLADEADRRVIVVDTSNEIAGDGDIPHPAIGRARRMQVASPSRQHAVMIEAVENHMPEVIVIDEIGTEAEAAAARTIAERGVQLVATAHGHSLANLISNPTLADLLGGIESVTLGDDEARRRRTQKTILERRQPPTFDVLIEIQDRTRLAVHHDVSRVVDAMLRQQSPAPEIRVRTPEGGFDVRTPEPAATTPSERAGRRRVLRIYPFAIAEERLTRAIRSSGARATIARSLGQADLLLTLRSFAARRVPKLEKARARGIPIEFVPNQSARTLAAFLASRLEEDDGALAALAEAEAAAQAVRDGGEPVALSAHPAALRRRQHQVAEYHGLASTSQGREPRRHVVLLPAPPDWGDSPNDPRDDAPGPS